MREAWFLIIGYIAGFICGGVIVYIALFRAHRRPR